MKIQRLFSILLFCSMLGSGSLMAQSMSDSQVLEYVKDGIRQGKEQKQLASELARKGVTKEQAMRVKQLYEQQNNVNTSQSTGTDINESRLREETKENTSDMLEDHPTTEDLAREDQVFGRNIFNTRNLVSTLPLLPITVWVPVMKSSSISGVLARTRSASRSLLKAPSIFRRSGLSTLAV